MTKPIVDYNVFNFRALTEAQGAHQRILSYVLRPEGRQYIQDDPYKRAVILAGPTTTLYLSPGALEIAETLWIKLPTSKVVHATDLPKGLRLLIGEPSDLRQ